MTLGITRHGYKYELSILDWIKYKWWEIVLFFKRMYRRIKRICSYSKATILVIDLWVLFLFLYCVFSKENILYEIKEARYEIFTSVVLVWFIELAEKIKQYKELLRLLFYKKIELENVASDLIQTLTNNNDTNDVFFSTEFFDLFFENNEGPWKINKNTKYMLTAYVENIDKILSDIKEGCLKNPDGSHTNEIIELIDIYANDTAYFRKMLCKKSVIQKYSLERFLGYLYEIIESISCTWRRDDCINYKMIRIISKNLHTSQHLNYYDGRLLYKEETSKKAKEVYGCEKKSFYIVKPKRIN